MSCPLSVGSWERAFIYDFMNLSFYARKRVIETLSLDQPEDVGKTLPELLDCYIERAKEKGQVEKLLKQVQDERERS